MQKLKILIISLHVIVTIMCMNDIMELYIVNNNNFYKNKNFVLLFPTTSLANSNNHISNYISIKCLLVVQIKDRPM